MDKILIIFRREYLNKVLNKRFLLTTLLTPLLFIVFILFVAFIFSYQSTDTRDIVIVDPANIMDRKIKDQNHFYFSFSDDDLEELLAQKQDRGWDGLLYLSPLNTLQDRDYTVRYYADKALDFQNTMMLENILNEKIRDYKILQLNMDEELISSLETDIDIISTPLDESKQSHGFLESSFGLLMGNLMGVLLMMMILINGTFVFHSVMEEKTNRIVEVMISTVKPFQLMFGKIMAAATVGLTQFLIWLIIIPLSLLLLSPFLGIDVSSMQEVPTQTQLDSELLEDMVHEIVYEIQKVNWGKTIITFVLFFLGGYYLYASLFAALGALAGDDPQQSNALTVPVSMILVVSIYLLQPVLSSPDSAISQWTSLIPFFSPVLMPALSLFDIPLWRTLLSFVILIGSSVLISWIAARIYRIGILMYGKRIRVKDVWRHLF